MDLVSLKDYALNGGDAAGVSTAADLDALTKAMYAGDKAGRDLVNQPTSGAGLQVESLEGTMRILTTKESDIILWKKVPKMAAYNTVEDYLLQTEYGSIGNSFNAEGELPEEDDSTFVRKSVQIKYMGTVRRVTHPMTLVNVAGIASAVQKQITDGTLKLLRDVNLALAFGDSKVNPHSFDGFYAQHRDSYTNLDQYYASEHVIDMKGKALSEEKIEDAALTIVENNGSGKLLMAPPRVLSGFTKRFHESKRIMMGTPAQTDLTAGIAVNQFMSQFGPIDLGYDKFLKSGASKRTTDPFKAKAPVAPTAGGTPKAAVTGTASNSMAGDYWYAVTAINKHGESALTVLGTTKLTVSGSQVVNLSFSATAGGYMPTGYRIYRTKVNPTAATAADAVYFPLFDVSVEQLAAGYDGAGAGLVQDKNRILPDTESCFFMEPTADIWAFKQLAPLMKMDLARLGPSEQFMILLYGTPVLYQPRKFVKFINVGTDITA